ncbi:MAG: PRC-barrel domain-containing protein [Candidatus Aenigmarchaeota archaeon]|nr:PRC-barrel domain-containing protein [Candidatus Aenigmarchaeota archaeon]MDW8149065.1 PRC-barrel domain-containing protein [Candidatus Aenigmarchaeota archaeon]
MVTTQNVMDLMAKEVFTEKGYYAGRVSDVELDLSKFRVRAIVVEIVKEGLFSKILGSKKGVIVPYSMVRAIGDIVIIKHVQLPTEEEVEKEEVTQGSF